MEKEKFNKYPTHPFLVVMENKVFASSASLLLGGAGVFLYGLISRDINAMHLGLLSIPTVAFGLTGCGVATIEAYEEHIDRYKKGDPVVKRNDYFEKVGNKRVYCIRTGIKLAKRDIREGKLELLVEKF